MTKQKKARQEKPPRGNDPTKAGTPDGKRDSPHKTAKSWLLAIACSVLVVLIVCLLVGRNIRANEGKDTPEDLAVSFLTALEHKDRRGLQRCLLSVDQNYENITETLFAYIKAEDSVTAISYDEIKYDKTDPESVAEIEEDMQLSGIQETVLVYMEVPMTRVKDGATYETVTAYYMTAFRARDKWFLYDIVKDATYVLSGVDADGNEVDPDEAYRLFNNRFVGGDEEIGYIPLDDTWYAVEPDEDSMIDGAMKDLAYIQETGNALIHMVMIETDEDIVDLTNQLARNLSSGEQAEIEVQALESTICGFDATCIGYYNKDADLYFFAWIVDSREYDGNVRYLSLECTADYTAACQYLTSFAMPYELVSYDEDDGTERDAAGTGEDDGGSDAAAFDE